MPGEIAVYLEAGSRRTFAGALDWPGWCRSGRDEASALEALAAYAERYRAALGALGPSGPPGELAVIERLKGSSTTDFGAPGAVPNADTEALEPTDLAQMCRLLRACWVAFDRAVDTAGDSSLKKGPRGGGRSVPAICEHLLEADRAYLGRLGVRSPRTDLGWAAEIDTVRQSFVEALAKRAAGELPTSGPRGGRYWLPRYGIRRSAWHALDHAWEIEDRL